MKWTWKQWGILVHELIIFGSLLAWIVLAALRIFVFIGRAFMKLTWKQWGIMAYELVIFGSLLAWMVVAALRIGPWWTPLFAGHGLIVRVALWLAVFVGGFGVWTGVKWAFSPLARWLSLSVL